VAIDTLLGGDRRIIEWQPPYYWVAAAVLLDDNRHIVGW
jgi:hypothetical protein